MSLKFVQQFSSCKARDAETLRHRQTLSEPDIPEVTFYIRT
jgi:hypothetical protein